jgi:hypothetical protein
MEDDVSVTVLFSALPGQPTGGLGLRGPDYVRPAPEPTWLPSRDVRPARLKRGFAADTSARQPHPSIASQLDTSRSLARTGAPSLMRRSTSHFARRPDCRLGGAAARALELFDHVPVRRQCHRRRVACLTRDLYHGSTFCKEQGAEEMPQEVGSPRPSARAARSPASRAEQPRTRSPRPISPARWSWPARAVTHSAG